MVLKPEIRARISVILISNKSSQASTRCAQRFRGHTTPKSVANYKQLERKRNQEFWKLSRATIERLWTWCSPELFQGCCELPECQRVIRGKSTSSLSQDL